MKKGIIKLILALVIVFLLVRLCTSSFGSVITLPGGMGGSESDGSGGWFSPKEKTNESSTVNDVTLDIKDLERELGIGTEKNQSPTINIPSSTSTTSTSTSSSTPLALSRTSDRNWSRPDSGVPGTEPTPVISPATADARSRPPAAIPSRKCVSISPSSRIGTLWRRLMTASRHP